jgi:hypothetical protein
MQGREHARRRIRRSRAAVLLALVGALAPACASAASGRPAAIVEDVSGAPDIKPMQYLSEGQRLSLKPGEEIVIGYLRSCVVETIAGGDITIGAERSLVERGTVSRRGVTCEAERLLPAAVKGDAGGAMIYRDTGHGAGRPEARIYGLSPVLSVAEPGLVRFQRLDQPASPIELELTRPEADLAKNGVLLAPNGLYRVSMGNRALVFRVDAAAKETAPLIARLLRL